MSSPETTSSKSLRSNEESSEQHLVEYSIVIPVYNSSKVVGETVDEIMTFFKNYGGVYEIILVNDGSTDDSWRVIKTLAKEHVAVRSFNLLKNYGQHSAVYCGFEHSRGAYIVTMDDDLQNPPGELVHLITKIKEGEGYDLVFAKFKQKKHSFSRRLGSKLIGYLNRKIFYKPKDIVLSNFRIFTREVCDRVIKYQTPQPYIPGLLLMFSSEIANVETDHAERKVGASNYNLFKILSLVARLLFNYSSYPLKLMTILGVIISLLTFGIGSYSLIKKLWVGVQEPGWTSLMVVTSFLNGFLILMIGALGEYTSRILRQASWSNSVIVKEEVE